MPLVDVASISVPVQRNPSTTVINAQVLDDDPTSVNSTSLDVSRYRHLLVYLTMESSGSPTTLQWIAQFSDDGGTTWYDYLEGVWAAMFYEDTVMSSEITECFEVPVRGSEFRLRAVAVGSDGSNTFTITAKVEPLD